jgi:hypothetical protein
MLSPQAIERENPFITPRLSSGGLLPAAPLPLVGKEFILYIIVLIKLFLYYYSIILTGSIMIGGLLNIGIGINFTAAFKHGSSHGGCNVNGPKVAKFLDG